MRPAPADRADAAGDERLLKRMACKDPVPDGASSKLQKMARGTYLNGWTYADLGTEGA